MKIRLISVCLSIAMAFALSISAYATEDDKIRSGWQTIGGNTFYIMEDGNPAVEDMNIYGVRYCFTPDGVCTGRYTGWTKSSEGRRYYRDGVLAQNKWLKATNGNRYYATENGTMATGWLKVEEGKGWQGWRFFNDRGVMYAGEVTINGNEYIFSNEGVLEQFDYTTSISSLFSKVEKNAPSDLYGGLYFDDGMIIIKSTDVEKMQEYMNEAFPNTIDYVISECRYTQKQLNTVLDKLTERLGEMNIVSTCTNAEQNCVIVGVTELTDDLKEFVSGINIGDCVRYEIVSGESVDD